MTKTSTTTNGQAEERCEITNNPCGTDTWVIGHPCQCNPCQRYVARTTPGSIGLLGPNGKPILKSEVPPRTDPGWQTWIIDDDD